MRRGLYWTGSYVPMPILNYVPGLQKVCDRLGIAIYDGASVKIPEPIAQMWTHGIHLTPAYATMTYSEIVREWCAGLGIRTAPLSTIRRTHCECGDCDQK